MKVKEAVSNVESIRKALQDFLAPELRGISVKLDGIDKRVEELSGSIMGVRDDLRGSILNVRDDLRSDLNGVRSELQAVEARTKEAIEQAKREILLTVRLAESEQQNVLLARKVSELEQKSPQ